MIPPTKGSPAALGLTARPRLRGWSHLLATVPALAMTGVLLGLAAGHPDRQVELLVYGLSAVALFAVSGTYHTRTWSPPRRALMRRLDHATIFLLVAGTYTPVSLTLLSGAWRVVIFTTAWVLAAVGMVLVVSTLRIPRWVLAGCYLLQGWVAIAALPVIGSAVGGGGLALVLVGGGLYTLGAVAYAVRWPTPVPGWFGYHEVFHLLVIAANALFFAFMVTQVARRA